MFILRSTRLADLSKKRVQGCNATRSQEMEHTTIGNDDWDFNAEIENFGEKDSAINCTSLPPVMVTL